MREMIASLREQKLTGRNRRLLNEWDTIERRLSQRDDIDYSITKFNDKGLAIEYLIHYKIESISSVTDIAHLGSSDSVNHPIFASSFLMKLSVPEEFPCIDAPLELNFITRDGDGDKIDHPWHPNIRYFGSFAGRVCLNKMDSYIELAWCIERVALYLRYERYHAINEPPYPEDLTVARWIVEQAEPMGWLTF